jgi:hypothetical protein
VPKFYIIILGGVIMNTQQIEQSESNVLPFNIDNLTSLDVAEISRAVAAKEAEEHNGIVDFVEQTTNENAFLKLQVSNLSNRLDGVIDENEILVGQRKKDEKEAKDIAKATKVVFNNAELHIQMLKQANLERDQMALKLSDAVSTIAEYKVMGSAKQILKQCQDYQETIAEYKVMGTAKKIREQRKDYRETIAKHLAGETQHKIVVKAYRKEVFGLKEEVKAKTKEVRAVQITSEYEHAGDHLWLFPNLMQIANRGMSKEEVCFLYLNDDGRGCLMSIDDDGEIVLGKAPIRPKAETKEHAGMLLRKFKKNGWSVQVDDLQVIGG